MTREFIEYQGVQLYAEEAAILVELEQQINEPLPLIPAFGALGFIAQGNQITKLALPDQNLSTPQLSTLFEMFGQLSNLQTLYLHYNQLPSLPESVGQLNTLQQLFMDCNQLRTLPETLGDLSNLQTLNLRANRLTSLPETIGNLHNLQKLNLAQNNLTSLPETIGNLKKLEVLHLYDNQLITLPRTIENLVSLSDLLIPGNPLDLASLLKVYWLVRSSTKLFGALLFDSEPSTSEILHNHPPLNGLYWIKKPSKHPCPLCGASELAVVQNNETQKEHLLCAQCESFVF